MGGLDDLFDAGAAVRPPLDAQALKAVPAKRGVFLVVADGDRPVLLASAADIRSRLRHRLSDPQDDQRRKSADLRQIAAGVHWRLTHSHFETDWRFMELARAIWPETYAQLLPRRSVWFVTARTDDPHPHLAATRQVTERGRHVGPFPSRRSAEAFIEALADAFDLCRCVSLLRRAPNAAACVYKEMGRCPAPCDGSMPMDRYRPAVERAAEFAGGRRGPHRQRLTEEMAAAAADLAFERAGVLKQRLDRLAEFDSVRFSRVRDLRAFRFVMVQRGPTPHQACTFVCDRGAVADGPVIDHPPDADPLARVLAACDELAAAHDRITPADCRRMGLVATYLFSDRARRGLILPRQELTAARLGEQIEAQAEALKLRPPGRRRKGAAGHQAQPAATVDP